MSSTTPLGDKTICLSFANSFSGEEPESSGYPALLAWAVGQLGISRRDLAHLEKRARARRREARSVWLRAARLARALRSVLTAVAEGQNPAPEPLEILNHELRSALPRLRLDPGEDCCRWEWSAPPDALDRLLWPVARSAADLLTSPDVVRVGVCASPTCSWLFLDESRNRRRKWCDMSTCGNRAKARRHYRRSRSNGQT